MAEATGMPQQWSSTQPPSGLVSPALSTKTNWLEAEDDELEAAMTGGKSPWATSAPLPPLPPFDRSNLMDGGQRSGKVLGPRPQPSEQQPLHLGGQVDPAEPRQSMDSINLIGLGYDEENDRISMIARMGSMDSLSLAGHSDQEDGHQQGHWLDSHSSSAARTISAASRPPPDEEAVEESTTTSLPRTSLSDPEEERFWQGSAGSARNSMAGTPLPGSAGGQSAQLSSYGGMQSLMGRATPESSGTAQSLRQTRLAWPHAASNPTTMAARTTSRQVRSHSSGQPPAKELVLPHINEVAQERRRRAGWRNSFQPLPAVSSGQLEENRRGPASYAGSTGGLATPPLRGHRFQQVRSSRVFSASAVGGETSQHGDDSVEDYQSDSSSFEGDSDMELEEQSLVRQEENSLQVPKAQVQTAKKAAVISRTDALLLISKSPSMVSLHSPRLATVKQYREAGTQAGSSVFASRLSKAPLEVEVDTERHSGELSSPFMDDKDKAITRRKSKRPDLWIDTGAAGASRPLSRVVIASAPEPGSIPDSSKPAVITADTRNSHIACPACGHNFMAPLPVSPVPPRGPMSTASAVEAARRLAEARVASRAALLTSKKLLADLAAAKGEQEKRGSTPSTAAMSPGRPAPSQMNDRHHRHPSEEEEELSEAGTGSDLYRPSRAAPDIPRRSASTSGTDDQRRQRQQEDQQHTRRPSLRGVMATFRELGGVASQRTIEEDSAPERLAKSSSSTLLSLSADTTRPRTSTAVPGERNTYTPVPPDKLRRPRTSEEALGQFETVQDEDDDLGSFSDDDDDDDDLYSSGQRRRGRPNTGRRGSQQQDAITPFGQGPSAKAMKLLGLDGSSPQPPPTTAGPRKRLSMAYKGSSMGTTPDLSSSDSSFQWKRPESVESIVPATPRPLSRAGRAEEYIRSGASSNGLGTVDSSAPVAQARSRVQEHQHHASTSSEYSLPTLPPTAALPAGMVSPSAYSAPLPQYHHQHKASVASSNNITPTATSTIFSAGPSEAPSLLLSQSTNMTLRKIKSAWKKGKMKTSGGGAEDAYEIDEIYPSTTNSSNSSLGPTGLSVGISGLRMRMAGNNTPAASASSMSVGAPYDVVKLSGGELALPGLQSLAKESSNLATTMISSIPSSKPKIFSSSSSPPPAPPPTAAAATSGTSANRWALPSLDLSDHPPFINPEGHVFSSENGNEEKKQHSRGKSQAKSSSKKEEVEGEGGELERWLGSAYRLEM